MQLHIILVFWYNNWCNNKLFWCLKFLFKPPVPRCTNTTIQRRTGASSCEGTWQIQTRSDVCIGVSVMLNPLWRASHVQERSTHKLFGLIHRLPMQRQQEILRFPQWLLLLLMWVCATLKMMLVYGSHPASSSSRTHVDTHAYMSTRPLVRYQVYT